MSKLLTHYPAMKLGDILTKEQIAETLRIMQLPVNEGEQTKQLKEYYGTFREQLEHKGILPDFLAYAVPFWIRSNL
jgi:hypothetical protein